MLPDQCQIALKEWAVTVESLAQGQQILLLRKGGIHEEGKDFKVMDLFPSYIVIYTTGRINSQRKWGA